MRCGIRAAIAITLLDMIICGVFDYLFGGDYWVVALRGDQTVPVAVKTGLTDLEYSEIVSGLEPGDRVLLLPSTSLYEQQELLQEFIDHQWTKA